jgi:hypothetical protein
VVLAPALVFTSRHAGCSLAKTTLGSGDRQGKARDQRPHPSKAPKSWFLVNRLWIPGNPRSHQRDLLFCSARAGFSLFISSCNP